MITTCFFANVSTSSGVNLSGSRGFIWRCTDKGYSSSRLGFRHPVVTKDVSPGVAHALMMEGEVHALSMTVPQ
jgi:hypothetical protein